MKDYLLFIFLAALIVSCATPLDEVIQEAKECVAGHHDEKGVLTPAPAEYSKECWAEANKRIESKARAEKRREERRNTCPSGEIMYCDRWGDCGCINRWELRRIIRGY